MSNISDFMPRGKPKRVVELTSGTGTFTPLEANSWCRVTMQAAGGGGGTQPSAASGLAGPGGGAGSVWTFWVRVSGATAYAVGAGGSGANAGNSYIPSNGGLTSFGNARLSGGSAGSSNNGAGGSSRYPLVNIGTNINAILSGVIPGGSGGWSSTDGGSSGNPYPYTCGFPPGHVPSSPAVNGGADTQAVQGGAVVGSYNGGGGGGSSMYGPGGAGGNGNSAGAGSAGANATGYGGGGGGGGAGNAGRSNAGNGSGGLIIIEEFGA